MSTDWTAAVRPVKSTVSVTSRATGRLTGMTGGSEGATGGGLLRQPPTATSREQVRRRTRGLRCIGISPPTPAPDGCLLHAPQAHDLARKRRSNRLLGLV